MVMQSYTGIVERGKGKGAMLGYPTINIPFSDASISGIYAAQVQVNDANYHVAVFIDTKRQLLEAHLLDFNGDLYGKEVIVTLEKKLRDSIQFSDEKQLKKAIAHDIEAVRAYFT